ncbi:hypothetical protein HK104_001037 [Borealophlyctis nickersoniae]|nr:hypothetical protein HK104_001037 [Borealophlyctis nickersoniae]
MPDDPYARLDDLEEGEEDDSGFDIVASASGDIALQHAPLPRRRNSKVAPSGGKYSMMSKLSTGSLLEMGIMKSVTRQSSAAGFFPHPSRAPSTSRLPIPWSHTETPRDFREADMLCGLALALASYGAPLYRVEHRIAEASKDLNIPVSIFCLPSTIMCVLGDGTPRHPTRSRYLAVSIGLNMGKLHEVDQLARRISHMRAGGGGNGKGGASRSRASSVSVKTAPLNPPWTQSSTASFPFPDTSSIPLESSPPSRQSSFPAVTSPDSQAADMDDLLHTLELITSSPSDYAPPIRIIAASAQSFVITILLFRGTWADSLAAMLLGAMTGVGIYLGELGDFSGAMELLIAVGVAFFARLLEQFEFWKGMSGNGLGLCHEVVTLGAICQLLPGISITLGMLELGSENPVAGSVRMFQSFIRALKLGYGLSMGSRVAVDVLQWFNLWNGFDEAACNAVKDAKVGVDFWRMPFWIPMNISIMIILKAYPSQWAHMSIVSLIGYLVSLVASQVFQPDTTAGIAAFTLGIAANLYARRTNQIAIAAVLSGSVGVRGAIAAFQKDAAVGGTTFGVDMITRAMSIAVGLYLSNLVAFPLVNRDHERDKAKDNVMAI